MKAVIDLGTNTFQLLIAQPAAGGLKVICNHQVPVKLGQGGIEQGVITADAFERGQSALAEFRTLLDQFAVTDISAVATSAIRSALNGREFMHEALTRHGIHVTAIPGEHEAILIYTAAARSFILPDENILVMDIGGGSVEFIIGRGEKILWKQSFEAGAARLISRFAFSDPPLAEEINNLNLYFEVMFQPLILAALQFPVHILAGSAGSFDTLVDVIESELNERLCKLPPAAHCISPAQFNRFCSLMKSSTIREKVVMKGMPEFRVEMIGVSVLMMEFITNRLGIQQVIASAWSLREGIFFSGLKSD